MACQFIQIISLETILMEISLDSRLDIHSNCLIRNNFNEFYSNGLFGGNYNGMEMIGFKKKMRPLF